MLTYDVSDSLYRAAFVTSFPAPIGAGPTPAPILSYLEPGARAPVERSEDLRKAVRALLREGGYKPSGRGKPSSEYLMRALGEGALTSINLAVDACNAVSYHSALPISVVDLGLAAAPLRIAIPDPGTTYVFNASGQAIDLTGLLCLWDAAGPCANAVKDSQRTKTGPTTTRTLSVLWGPASHAPSIESALAWYRELLEEAGASTASA